MIQGICGIAIADLRNKYRFTNMYSKVIDGTFHLVSPQREHELRINTLRGIYQWNVFCDTYHAQVGILHPGLNRVTEGCPIHIVGDDPRENTANTCNQRMPAATDVTVGVFGPAMTCEEVSEGCENRIGNSIQCAPVCT